MLEIVVPATTANVGPGFDTLGLALNLYNKFYITEIENGLEITGCDDSYKNENNLIYTSMQYFYKIDCQYKCNTLYSCCIKYLCRCLISKTLARSIIYYGNNIIKFFLIYRRKIKLFRVKLS